MREFAGGSNGPAGMLDRIGAWVDSHVPEAGDAGSTEAGDEDPMNDVEKDGGDPAGQWNDTSDDNDEPVDVD